MKSSDKMRYRIWAIAILVAAILLLFSRCFADNPNKTTILVNAPEAMMQVFESTFEKLNLDKDYIIEYTDDTEKANFVVKEGLQKEGELIAYSPIVAVFDYDEQLEKNLIERGIFVQSEANPEKYDFDFKKILDDIVNGNGSEFKIYIPSTKSDIWGEFYHFLLFTIDDEYYRKSDEEFKNACNAIKEFMHSGNVEYIDNNTLVRNDEISKKCIYFMPYADLCQIYQENGKNYICKVMYPKSVVYHSYYANFDETGKILYDALDKPSKFLSNYSSKHLGYDFLRLQGYNTKYSLNISNANGAIRGIRTEFNGVEIPGWEIEIFEEEQKDEVN